jgi:hypothetical protein
MTNGIDHNAGGGPSEPTPPEVKQATKPQAAPASEPEKKAEETPKK